MQNFTYTFDRYGNRWAQNAPQGGPTLSISFNKGNNIINAPAFPTMRLAILAMTHCTSMPTRPTAT